MQNLQLFIRKNCNWRIKAWFCSNLSRIFRNYHIDWFLHAYRAYRERFNNLILALCSEVGKSLNKVVELISINLATTILIELIVALFEVFFVPGRIFVSSCHYAHDELFKVFLCNDWLLLVIHNCVSGVVLVEYLFSEHSYLHFDFTFRGHILLFIFILYLFYPIL